MIVPQDRTLMKNKNFMAVLAFGILLSLSGVIVRAIYNEKAANSTCASGTCFGVALCYQDGGVYCCGGSSGYYQCGEYTSCTYMGEDCQGYMIAQWVIFGISALILIALIFMAKKHKTDRLRQQSAEILQGQNIVYSDANNVRVGGINDSVSSDYHRV